MKEPVRTDAAPAPFQGAPYSQAIKTNGFVFVSGQLALKPGAKELVPGGIAEQTEQVFANLRAILEAAGSSLEQIRNPRVDAFRSEADEAVCVRKWAEFHPNRRRFGARFQLAENAAENFRGRLEKERALECGSRLLLGKTLLPCLHFSRI